MTFAFAAEVSAASPTSESPVPIGDRLELFIDRHLIDRMDGVELRLGQPVNMGPVLAFDAPWDGRFSGYVTIIKDDATYRMYYRGKPNATADGSDDETTCYAESVDGIHWSKVAMMEFDNVPPEQLYNNNTSPYFRAPHIYIGLMGRIVFNRPVVTPAEVARIGMDPRYARDTSEPVLITSRGGTRYDRTFLETWIRNGIGAEHWTSRSNYPALNFSTSVVGGVRVEVQDPAGKPIPGYALAESVEVVGNEIERIVGWKGGSDLGRLRGIPVRLRFVMKESDLYAFRFK